MELDQFIKTGYGQGIFCCVIALALLVVGRPKNANAAYTVTGLAYFGFILFNSVMVFWTTEPVWSYFLLSMLISVVTLWLMSVITSVYLRLWRVGGSGESGMIFLVVMYHPLMLLVVMGVRWILR